MKSKLIVLGLAACLVAYTNVAFGQSGKFGVGLQGGVQKFYSDFLNAPLGPGIDGFVSFRYLKFADLSMALGYSQLKAGVGKNQIFTADLKTDLELISKGLFRPLVSLGAGMISYQSFPGRKLTPAFFGGGGFRFRLSPKLAWHVVADYRFTLTDQIDNFAGGKSKDGYLNVRTGITFYPGGEEEGRPQILADLRAPLFEVEADPDTYRPFQDEPFYDNVDGGMPGQQEAKDMEEYVKFKSRIDALSQDMDSKEKKIIQMQNALNERKRTLASMENRAEKQPGRSLPKNSSMSGFSEIYEEALINYYNKNYTEAISLLRLLLQQYSSHSLASNCQYWIAQSMFSMNQYGDSIDEFYKVLSYQRSLKKDDSIFLLGQAYLKIGEGERAKESFTRLIREYPHSEFVQGAQSYLRNL
ncbi:tetratricopeptide repeat protein [candidate division KSB1 bacterium]|nr:tetratricopeptide repeat protein [candidate division KSB1 bacterium]